MKQAAESAPVSPLGLAMSVLIDGCRLLHLAGSGSME